MADRFSTGPGARRAGSIAFWLVALLLAAGALLFGGTLDWAEGTLHVVAGITAAVAAARAWLSRDRSVVTVLDAAVIVFAGYVTTRYLLAPAEVVARSDWLNTLAVATVFLAVARHLPTPRHATGLALVVVGLGTLHATLALWQRLAESPYLLFGMLRHPQYGLRVSGNYVCPNHLAGFLEMALPLALALALLSRLPMVVRALLAASAALMAAAQVFSVSRGGWISLAVGLVAMLVIAVRSGRMGWVAPAVVVGLLCTGMFAAYQSMGLARERIEAMNRPEAEIRLTLWRDAAAIIRAEPWWGWGPGMFRYAHHQVQAPGYQTIARYTHNDYLNLLCDYGVVGGLLAAAFLGALVAALAAVGPRAGNGTEGAVWLGSCGALAALLTHSLVDFNLHIPANALAFFAVVALPIGQRRRATHAILTGPRAGVLWAVVLAAASLCLLVKGVRGTVAGAARYAAEWMGDSANSAEVEQWHRVSFAWDPLQNTAAERLADLHRVRAATATNLDVRVAEGVAAIEWYDRARRNNPFTAQTLRKMALTYEVLRRFPEAFLLYRKALELDPHNPVTHRLLADHYAKRGLLREALAAYDDVLCLRADPETARLRVLVQEEIERRARREARTP